MIEISLKKTTWILCLGVLALAVPAAAQVQGSFERTLEWGPTFSVTVMEIDGKLRLDWIGHPALTPDSRRIDTLDLTINYTDRDSEKLTREGVSELREGTLELEGDWKEIRLSYKTRRPGTVTTGRTRVACRLKAKKITLPASVLFESYEEGPRCTISDNSE